MNKNIQFECLRRKGRKVKNVFLASKIVLVAFQLGSALGRLFMFTFTYENIIGSGVKRIYFP